MQRRDVLKLGGAAAAAGALGLHSRPGLAEADPVKTVVSGPGHIVKVHMEGMRSGIFPDPKASRLMVDKAVTVKREKIGQVIGQIDAASMVEIERRLAVFLGIAK